MSSGAGAASWARAATIPHAAAATAHRKANVTNRCMDMPRFTRSPYNRTASMLDRVFALTSNRTTPTREFQAGLTTFAAMAYILAVNPSILADADWTAPRSSRSRRSAPRRRRR